MSANVLRPPAPCADQHVSALKKRLRVLIVEDNPWDADLMVRELKRSDFEPDWTRVETGEELKAGLSPSVDVILSDFRLPGFDALEALSLVKAGGHETPFIIVSGSVGEDVAVAALKSGADDFLLKDRLGRLGAAVAHAVERRQFREEQRRSEAQLRASERRFSKAFQACPVGICICTLKEGRFIDVNEVFLKMFGYRRDEVIGRESSELGMWPDLEDRRRWEKALEQRGAVMDAEQTFRRKNGELGHALASFDTLDFGGEVCVLALFQDITERRKLQEQLRQAQKVEAIGQLAGGVAHDFNNLLTVIAGYAQMMLAETAADGEHREPLSEILAAADRAACLTRQLLSFSRKQVVQAKMLDVGGVISGVSKLLQRVIGEDITLFADCMPGIPPVYADAGMLEQVLMNLALNARDAMPEGGRLVIGARKSTIDETAAKERPRRRAGEFVCVQVSDTGRGITPEILDRIFEPFFTTKEPGKGTGLGLATVFNVVQMHHGWIEVDSKPGQGSAFRVYLPLAGSTVEPARERETVVASANGAETVLLVEDEPGVRQLAAAVLKRRGYTVFEAASGVEALSSWPDYREKIDILVTDMVLPHGVSGKQLADRLRGLKPELKIVFTSGYCSEAMTSAVDVRLGGNFLQKPYWPDQLARIVRENLDAKPACQTMPRQNGV